MYLKPVIQRGHKTDSLFTVKLIVHQAVKGNVFSPTIPQNHC